MSVDVIASELIIPTVFLLFILGLLFFVICYLIKYFFDNAKEMKKDEIYKTDCQNKEFENRLKKLELKLKHVEIKPVGYDDFIS